MSEYFKYNNNHNRKKAAALTERSLWIIFCDFTFCRELNPLKKIFTAQPLKAIVRSQKKKKNDNFITCVQQKQLAIPRDHLRKSE